MDGQGGGVGKAIVERLKAEFPELAVIACGTNVIATNAMLKAGADEGATGAGRLPITRKEPILFWGQWGL